MLLLIDGDILIYQAIAAAEQELEFDEGLFQYCTNIADAKDNFIGLLQSILTKANQEDYCLCLTDPKVNWRKAVYPEYKSNRKSTRKPLAFREFRTWVEQSYKTYQRPTLEADDVIGIMATKPGNKAIIWSIDKDLKQIPGLHLDVKDSGGPLLTEVLPHEGEWLHLRQTLTGDTVDGYPGCKRVGPVGADKIIGYPGDVLALGVAETWTLVCNAYAKAGFTEEYALVQARVAKICQWNDWDTEKQEVKLWVP